MYIIVHIYLGCADRDEQMSNGYPSSLVNDEQMSNKVGVKHQPDMYIYCPHQDPTFKLFGNPWGRLFLKETRKVGKLLFPVDLVGSVYIYIYLVTHPPKIYLSHFLIELIYINIWPLVGNEGS